MPLKAVLTRNFWEVDMDMATEAENSLPEQEALRK
jgi:hypothetical protein